MLKCKICGCPKFREPIPGLRFCLNCNAQHEIINDEWWCVD